MKAYRKSLWIVLGLISAAGVALAYVGVGHRPVSTGPETAGPVTAGIDLVNDKVLQGSDGRLAVSLTLHAQPPMGKEGKTEPERVQPADLVVVLDRSGSMRGRKMMDARGAAEMLIDRLSSRDRLALVTYANGVRIESPLAFVDDARRRQLKAALERIGTGGGTNLGGGLQRGIETLLAEPLTGRQRKVILISDGLANQGITDPHALGRMAANAAEQNAAVSTVGVGYDFNETLMTAIADYGTGRYHFLEDPRAFARVFESELQSARHVAASNLEIRIPLKQGVRLVDAGGYPVRMQDGHAVFHPGDLLAGGQRRIFLTFRVPTDTTRTFALGPVEMRYSIDGDVHHRAAGPEMTVACVADHKSVMAGIDETSWSAHVLQEAYGRLKDRVADAIRKGEKETAMTQIRQYETRIREVNATVGSAQVAENLDGDLQQLRGRVEETFAGPPAAVAQKKKQASKALQFDSYRMRRDRK